MKKPKPETIDMPRAEYQRSDFPNGLVLGKFVARAQIASNIIILAPELTAAFPNSAAVNDALRAILKVAQSVALES